MADAAAADRAEVAKPRPPANAFRDFFSKNFNPRNVLEVVNLDEAAAGAEKKQDAAKSGDQSAEQAGQTEPQKDGNPEWYDRAKLKFVGDQTQILPPQETPSVRLNADAPDSIKALVACKRLGDRECAQAYAKQYVRYQQNYFFELRELVQYIGEAMIEQGVIDEDNWVGVGQLMDYELAKTRYERGELIKPTHDVAMKRIVPDAKNQVEIFYFFSLSCSWCRYMAPDVERLWQMAKADPNVKMTALAIGPMHEDWLAEYRRYTGMTMPVMSGDAVAREFDIAFVPAVVIVAQNGKRAYLKTGQQTFERMYEFMRTVQGLPATVTPRFQQVASTPVGQAELMHAGGGTAKSQQRTAAGALVRVAQPAARKIEVEKF